MYPNDADGNAIRGALAPLLEKAGYTIVDPGAYQDGTTDFTSQIAMFKQKNCQIFNTFPIPPDFTTFWRQAAAAGLHEDGQDRPDRQDRPVRLAGPGRRLTLGYNLATGGYWGPTWPGGSSLDRHLEQGARRWLSRPRRVSTGTSSSARAWRCSTSASPR